MNCNHVQELLPLYVGGDLEEKRAKLVTTHVQSCAECAGEAVEYRETRELLQGFAPPTFSEGVYAGIRQRVLSEISRESSARTLPESIASLFRPRIRWAVASALLLAVAALAFYFVSNERNERQQSATSTSPSSESSDGPALTNTGENTGQDRGPIAVSPPGLVDTASPGSINRTNLPRRKSSLAVSNRGKSLPANAPDTRSITAVAIPAGNNPAPDAVPVRDPAISEKTLRVEMQTKDPNVRIIWFSQQRTKQVSPGKSSKGIQEVRSYV